MTERNSNIYKCNDWTCSLIMFYNTVNFLLSPTPNSAKSCTHEPNTHVISFFFLFFLPSLNGGLWDVNLLCLIVQASIIPISGVLGIHFCSWVNWRAVVEDYELILQMKRMNHYWLAYSCFIIINIKLSQSLHVCKPMLA